MKVEESMKLTNVMTWLAAAVVLLGVSAGCQDENHDGFFKGDAQGERVNKMIDVQASNGARNDGMLYARHFDGGKLNSLGRQKVLLMLEDAEGSEPVTVHLVNCGEGDVLTERKNAVELYLKTSEGPNKLTFHPASNDIVRFAKTESGKAEASETTVDTSSMSAGASGGGSK